MRHIWLLAACLGLGGCVLPPGVTYFSFALDGVSLVTTGKSVSDHALSAAVEKDCAMWRLLQEQDIKAVCREYADESETAITVAGQSPRAASRDIHVRGGRGVTAAHAVNDVVRPPRRQRGAFYAMDDIGAHVGAGGR